MNYLEAKKEHLENKLKKYKNINIGIELVVYTFYIVFIAIAITSSV